MTIDVTLFVFLVAGIVVLGVLCVLFWLAHNASSKNVVSMSETIASQGRDTAHLRAEVHRLSEENVLLHQSKATAENMATALGEATRLENARNEAAMTSGVGLFSVLGNALAFHQVEPPQVVEILLDLEVGEQMFVAAFLNSYFGWPGEAVEPEDYTEEQTARADLVRDALGVLK